MTCFPKAKEGRRVVIVVTTTWNSATLIDTFLRHYRALGVDQVLVMDFDSSDGTDELLRSSEWAAFVRTVPFTGLAGLDSSNLMLDLARDWFGPDAVCLFCDPDELLAVPEACDVGSPLGAADAVVLPRHNVTGLRSVAASEPDSLSALRGLTLRIDGRCERVPIEDMHKERLVPPWIYTAIPGKVLVRAGRVLSIGAGDHVAVVAPGDTSAPLGLAPTCCTSRCGAMPSSSTRSPCMRNLRCQPPAGDRPRLAGEALDQGCRGRTPARGVSGSIRSR